MGRESGELMGWGCDGEALYACLPPSTCCTPALGLGESPGSAQPWPGVIQTTNESPPSGSQDTLCLLAAGPGTVVIAFRGTASVAGLLADMKVGTGRDLRSGRLATHGACCWGNASALLPPPSP